jgi:hypothetical protein
MSLTKLDLIRVTPWGNNEVVGTCSECDALFAKAVGIARSMQSVPAEAVRDISALVEPLSPENRVQLPLRHCLRTKLKMFRESKEEVANILRLGFDPLYDLKRTIERLSLMRRTGGTYEGENIAANGKFEEPGAFIEVRVNGEILPVIVRSYGDEHRMEHQPPTTLSRPTVFADELLV